MSWYHRLMYLLGFWLHWRTRFWDPSDVAAHDRRWAKEFGY